MNIIVNNLCDLEPLNTTNSFSAVFDKTTTVQHASIPFTLLSGAHVYTDAARGRKHLTLPCITDNLNTAEAATFVDQKCQQIFQDHTSKFACLKAKLAE
jgi:hypothetical protein